MTYKELEGILKEHCSRFILLGGFGCVELFVPYRDAEKVSKLMQDIVPFNEQCVHSLQEFKITLKKGEYVTGLLHEKTFDKICSKYFKETL